MQVLARSGLAWCSELLRYHRFPWLGLWENCCTQILLLPPYSDQSEASLSYSLFQLSLCLNMCFIKHAEHLMPFYNSLAENCILAGRQGEN